MDPRYKFIRGKPFQGLSDYLEARSIKTKKQKITYPIPSSLQNTLFPEITPENPAFGLRQRLGHFYELISKSISGGLVKNLYVLNNDPNEKISKSEPDITTYKKNNRVFLREVKSVAPGQSLKLFDDQIAKYVSLQTGEYFCKTPSIRFDIFRHGISKIQKKYMRQTLEVLIADLSKSTKYLISLPFSVVFEIYKGTKEFSSRYDGIKYSPLTRFSSLGMNEFIANPEYALKKMNINLDNLIIEKRKFPKTVKINNNRVEPFPIVLITDKRSENKISKEIKKELDSNSELANRFYFNQDSLDQENNFFEPIPDEDVPF